MGLFGVIPLCVEVAICFLGKLNFLKNKPLIAFNSFLWVEKDTCFMYVQSTFLAPKDTIKCNNKDQHYDAAEHCYGMIFKYSSM